VLSNRLVPLHNISGEQVTVWFLPVTAIRIDKVLVIVVAIWNYKVLILKNKSSCCFFQLNCCGKWHLKAVNCQKNYWNLLYECIQQLKRHTKCLLQTAHSTRMKWKCIDFKCVRKTTKSRLSLTHHANKSRRGAE